MTEKNTPHAPETPELAEAFRQAYAGVLQHGAQLLAVWRSNLTDQHAADVADLEDKGMTLGLLIGAPKGRLTIQAIMVDAVGGIKTLEEISLSGH